MSSETDIDRELHGMRRLDALVLRDFFVPPDHPRAQGKRLGYQLRVWLSGARGAMRRLERRGYIESGWTLDHDHGATFELTDLGKKVAPAAAFAVDAEWLEHGRVQPFWWLRGRLRTR